MQVPSAKQRIDLPDGMRSKLESFRRRLWWIKIGEGILAGFAGLMVSYALVFALDRVWDTSAALRASLLILGSVGLGIAFPLKFHRWVWRTRQLEQVARLLRHKLPRLGDQLLGIVELAQADVDDQTCSTALLRAAVNQVDRDIAKRDFKDAVPHPRLRTWGWTAAALAALVVAAFLVVPAASRNAFVRWLAPWSQTERYTFAQLDQLPDKLVVPYAEDFNLETKLSAETAWSPGSASAQYGKQDAIRSELANGGYDFHFPPQKEVDAVTVSVGDARKTLTVEPTTRPELSDIEARVALPAYLQYSSDQMRDVRGGTISLVKGSLVSFTGTATRPLSGATFDGQLLQAAGNSIRTEPQPVTESAAHEITWRDSLGLSGKKPLVISVKAQDDAAPSISCSDLSFEQVVLDEEVLTFEIKATDDFGVKNVGMEWVGIENQIRNPHPAKGEKLLMGGEPEKRDLPVSATFSAKREEIPPQSLKLRMFTTDYLPDRKRVYSPTYVIHVLSPEEHAIWLTRQMERWFHQAQEVYENEQQLYQANVELRALSAEEMDQPENRRKLENQAAAEAASGKRLEAVSGAGEQLIRQAMRNNQFNVPTLEAWAAMLNSLKDIAKNRMPSVAGLLGEGAKAAATARSANPKPGAQGQAQNKNPNGPQVGQNKDGLAGGGGPPKTGDVPPVPRIADMESGHNKDNSGKPKDGPPTPASAGSFKLPVTTIMGGGPPPPDRPAGPTPPQQKVAQAVEEQQQLLDEFARVAAELQKILDNLEGSTFVKRLKAAARRQQQVATDLNIGILMTFGLADDKIDKPTAEHSSKIADRERAHGDTIWDIQSDIKAYYNRVRDGKFKNILDQMEAEKPVAGLAQVSETIKMNYTGRAIAKCEYWADTLDRWAEELVGPACPNGQCPPGKGNSLPPHIVLQIMKILEKEIDLREETRAAEKARPTLKIADVTKRAKSLGITQTEIAELVVMASGAILELPNHEAFGQEIGMLGQVDKVMREAAELLLAKAETGDPTIAAETEAIELLLQTRRVRPGGSGSGGNSPGAGGGGEADIAALALIGEGDDPNAQQQARLVGQATGAAGSPFPAEFRTGLDAFFGALEGTRDLETK
ncbi:MAG: hypothetical protein WD669_00230 [Pirellulales bacterium]